MSWLGIDIGGANIKIADGHGFAHSENFPLWQQPEQLPSKLRQLLSTSPAADSLAITMTGELADCYETKAAGVHHILDAVKDAAKERTVEVYLCDGKFAPVTQARREPLLAAASNWHVLATYATRFLNDRSGLLIDVGSTTTDLIQLTDNAAEARGMTDPERLAYGELIYTGVVRSPICAVVTELPWHNQTCRVAQELFATTQDAYVVLGDLPEQPESLHTADSRPLTREYAHARLARCVCADTTIFSWEDAVEAAHVICRAQVNMIANAATQVLKARPLTIVISGQGEFLARRVVDRLGFECEILSLSDQLGDEASRCACAHALATLANERPAP